MDAVVDQISPKARLAPLGDELSGLCAVVTGAASGIGLYVTQTLLQMGARVAAVDIDSERLRDLSRSCDERSLLVIRSALGSTSDADIVFSSAYEKFGNVNGLIGCAGAAFTGTIAEIVDEAWNDCIAQNLTSQFVCLRAFLKLRSTSTGPASAVLIGSKTAVAPGLGFGAYAIAKAGVVQLARIAALEGGEYGVRVNVINPGAIFEGSRFWRKEVIAERAKINGIEEDKIENYYAKRNALRKTVTIEDVGSAVIFLLSSWSAATTGCIISVDGGDEHAFSR